MNGTNIDMDGDPVAEVMERSDRRPPGREFVARHTDLQVTIT